MTPPRLTIRSARATAVAAPLLLIDLETEEGVTGRSYLFCYVGMAAAAIARVLDDAVEAVAGDRLAPLDVAAKLARRYRLIGVQGIVRMALAGLDVALWDALSIAAGLPLVSFLGGSPRPIPAYNSNGLGLMAPEKVADEAEELLEHGFRAVKLRLGRAEARDDLAAVRAVRRRLPDEAALMVEYNQALSVADALARGQALAGEGVYWVEEPIRHDDYVGCASLARALSTPVQIGENFAGVQAMAAALAAGASDYVMPDLERIGGVTGWQRAAALAMAAGLGRCRLISSPKSAHICWPRRRPVIGSNMWIGPTLFSQSR